MSAVATDEVVDSADDGTTRWTSALNVVASLASITGVALNGGRVIVWTSSLSGLLLSAYIVGRAWRRHRKSVPLLAILAGALSAAVASGALAYDWRSDDLEGDIADLRRQEETLRHDNAGLSADLAAAEQERADGERASPGSPTTTEPNTSADDAATTRSTAGEAQPGSVVFLVDLDPSRTESEDPADEIDRCTADEQIGGQSYPNQACWNIYSSTGLLTEWTLAESYGHLRGVAGILDSCPDDVSYGLRILGNGALLYSTTMVVYEPRELDVSLPDGIQRLTLEIDAGSEPDEDHGRCASIGELRLE